MNAAYARLGGTTTGASERAAEASLLALATALAVGALALAAPPLALLCIAGLSANALVRGADVRINIYALVGPLTLTVCLGAIFGFAAGVGTLFAWRLYQDTRWSLNEAKRLAQLAGKPKEATNAALAHAWLTPIYGLTLVAYTAPHLVAGFPLDLPHVPGFAPLIAGALALGAVFDWGLRRMADWRLGEVSAAPTAHLLAHHTLFLAAFGLTLDVSAGVVALIAWRLAHAAPHRQANLTAVP